MKYSVLVLSMLLFSISSAAEPIRETLPKLDKPFKAPDFSLQGEDGKQYRLADYKGQLVVLNFWATWCPPCRFEMPALERVWQQVKGKDIVVLAINVGENTDTIFEFTGQYPMSFPIPMDINGEIVKKYKVVGLPTTYIINPNGLVTHRAVGSREWDEKQFLSSIRSMLQQQ